MDTVSRAVTAPPMTPVAASASADFEQRWAEWRAKGLAHDRLVRRRMVIGMPILIILGVLVFAAFVR